MPSSFHQRCQLALTHPVTLGAVALLLVNDWLLCNGLKLKTSSSGLS